MSFRLHPAACAAAPLIFARGRNCAPKTDAWVWMAFNAFSARLPREQREYSTEDALPCLSIPYKPTNILLILGATAVVAGDGRPQFGGTAWRDLSAALRRLEGGDLRFPITVQGGWRHRRFEGPLVRRAPEDKSVMLRGCPPPSGNYFVLLPDHVFEARALLGETATAALLRLAYFHRGSRKRGPGAKLEHRWRIDIDRDALDQHALMAPRRGRVTEQWERLLRAFDELCKARFLTFEATPRTIRASLSQDFFHSTEPTK